MTDASRHLDSLKRVSNYTKSDMIAETLKANLSSMIKNKSCKPSLMDVSEEHIYDENRRKGKNKYSVHELRQIALSKGIDIKIQNRYKTFNMLCEELSGGIYTLNFEKLDKGEYNITDTKLMAQSLHIPIKINNISKCKEKLSYEIKNEYLNKIKNIAPLFKLIFMGNNSHIIGLTYFRNISRHLDIENYIYKSKKTLYNEIFTDYIEHEKITTKTSLFNGVCLNPNIFGEDWNGVNCNDVIIDEYGYCFDMKELLYYYSEGKNTHPWINRSLEDVKLKSSQTSLFDYISSYIDHDMTNCHKLLVRKKEYELIDCNTDINKLNETYLIDRLESYITSFGFYMSTTWINNKITDKNYIKWWTSLKYLDILKDQNEILQFMQTKIKSKQELLECLNYIYDIIYSHLKDSYVMSLYLLLRNDKIYTISQINTYLAYGFPDDTFQF